MLVSLPLLALLAAAPLAALALDNGLGLTPPLGWNSWNTFQENIDEQLIREMADAMVSTGVRDYGYTYLNLDDFWMGPERDPVTSRLVADPIRFPSGMKALGDYIHSRGLKFGIYTSSGTKTCGGLPASLYYEQLDAQTFADWGVDFVKMDNCNNDGRSAPVRYGIMRDALNATGRPIFFSMCSWGQEDVAAWGADFGNSWRTTVDITDQFTGKTEYSWLLSVTEIIDINNKNTKYGGPGGFNDVDMLEVGVGNLTPDENRAHFALWAALKSPLLIGADLRKIDADSLSVLLNVEILRINQDPLGKSVSRIRRSGNFITGYTEIWAGPLSDGSQVAILFNRKKSAASITLDFKDLGFNSKGVVRMRELNEHVDLGLFSGSYTTKVRSHAVEVLRIYPVETEMTLTEQ